MRGLGQAPHLPHLIERRPPHLHLISDSVTLSVVNGRAQQLQLPSDAVTKAEHAHVGKPNAAVNARFIGKFQRSNHAGGLAPQIVAAHAPLDTEAAGQFPGAAIVDRPDASGQHLRKMIDQH